MKIIASILIMYFCMLIAQPFVSMGSGINNDADSFHPGMCCKGMAKHRGQKPPMEQSTTCNRDFCNPFVPCGISLAYRAPLVSLNAPVREASKKLKPATNEDIISNYLSDCWRPPKQLS